MSFDVDVTTTAIVNQLFNRLLAMNPAFKQSWPTEAEFKATKKEWILAFQDARIDSVEKVQKGLKELRLSPSPFVPSPGEFISMCRLTPEDIGAPPVEQAFDEACRQAHPQSWKPNWSHAIVMHAYQRTGSSVFLNSKKETSYKKFQQHYDQACLDYQDGKIMAQIEYKTPFSKSDIEEPETIGQYEFVRPGVLKQYEHVSSFEEFKAICDKIIKNDDTALRALVDNIERQMAQK